MKVAKFGGSSLADAGQFAKVKKIVQADPKIGAVVCSAPGKSPEHDHKITDLLLLCHSHVQQGLDFKDIFAHIADRFLKIAADLKLNLPLKKQLQEIESKIAGGASAAYAASRGEYLSGLLLAEYLEADFIEAAEIIRFKNDGRIESTLTREAIRDHISGKRLAVVPGFYGAKPNGEIAVFSRGGSDVTGAFVAAGVTAEVYENWTDVSGLLMADPGIVDNPKRIERVTYRELRELSYMGARVLHDEAVFPVREANVPVHVRNTNAPYDQGTHIVPKAEITDAHGGISGIAGRKDFTVIAMEKALMNLEVGFGRRALEVLARHQVNYEHTPTGIDSMSLIISDSELDNKLEAILEDLQAECRPDHLVTYPNMALIAIVGRGMAQRPGVAAKVFGALEKAQVNVRMIDQGSSELNIILGVEAEDFSNAVQALYKAFVG
jgi:aspartate kinase